MDTIRSKNRIFKKVSSTLLGILAILAIAFPAAGSASAQTPMTQFQLKIRAYLTDIPN
jgi:hypothetical protein